MGACIAQVLKPSINLGRPSNLKDGCATLTIAQIHQKFSFSNVANDDENNLAMKIVNFNLAYAIRIKQILMKNDI